MTLGEKIKALRENMMLSKIKMGKLCGLSPTSIEHYEKDTQEPSLFAASCIAKACGVTLDYLAGIEKVGHWEKTPGRQILVRCSECGHTDLEETNYCPECGAKMDEEAGK